MIVPAVLSALHVLTLVLGLWSVVARGRALAGPLDDEGWKKLLEADSAWGAAAFLWLSTGLARVFFGGKETDFYWSNAFFWLKMALFAIVVALEIAPMLTFVRVRAARARGEALPSFPVRAYRRINALETAIVIAIPFVAAFMARGAWLF